jgi:5-methylcytosine-specific restriction endonuclease McrA
MTLVNDADADCADVTTDEHQRGAHTDYDLMADVLIPLAVGRLCPRCGFTMHAGHTVLAYVIPPSRGGADTFNNLRTICSTCATAGTP